MNTENDATNNHPSIHLGQKFRLLQSMLLARNPGACEYVRNGEPVCVIGQLAVKEGADPADLEPWGIASVNDLLCEDPSCEWEDPAGALDALTEYPVGLLQAVQRRFDDSLNPEVFPSHLAAMYDVLNDYPARNVQPGDRANGMHVSSPQDAGSFNRFFSAGIAALEEVIQDRIDQGAG